MSEKKGASFAVVYWIVFLIGFGYTLVLTLNQRDSSPSWWKRKRHDKA